MGPLLRIARSSAKQRAWPDPEGHSNPCAPLGAAVEFGQHELVVAQEFGRR